MPSFDIIRKSSPEKSFRVASVIGKFDLNSEHIEEHFKGEINLPDNWQIGLIVGKSGTGKTTIAKELFSKNIIDKFEYSSNSILDDMPKNKNVEEITKAFNAVGFSSPPSWLKSYSVLSNGEKMRVDLARAILEENEMFVFDEFTSVVDRQVAKIGSFAMQKAIRKSDKKFIAVTCHYDVEDWLIPDWTFSTDTMTFSIREEIKKNRPSIRFRIFEIEKGKDRYWNMFARYHYLSSMHSNRARVFILYVDDDIVGFCSVFHFPHPSVKNMKKVHRLVILPDYQGIGLGIKLLEEVGKIIKFENNRYTITTSSPPLIFSLKNNKQWRCTNFGRNNKHGGLKNTKVNFGSQDRLTGSFELN